MPLDGYPSSMRPAPFLIWTCLAMAILSGCQAGGSSATPSEPVIQVDQWPFSPESIRVHPLSRIKYGDDGSLQVQGRIEFLDRDGFSTRGVGTLKIILAGSSSGGSHAESSWESDLNDLETNGQYYDEVTRTYLYSLSLDEVGDVPLEPSLHVRLVLPDGRILSDKSDIHVSRSRSGSDDLDD